MDGAHPGDRATVARKGYRCYLCGRPVEAGRWYVRRFGVDSDDFCVMTMHEGCEARTRGWVADEGGSCEEFDEEGGGPDS